jgi:hypothetical protein
VSRDRGIRAQNWLARLLATSGWPNAEAVGSGRNGSDIVGTPGIVWENKTARQWKVNEWVRQAKGHRLDPFVDLVRHSQLAITVYWPPGVGEQTPECALAILPLPELLALLRAAGYGTELPQASEGITR